MSSLLQIGTFFDLDDNGFLKNIAHPSLVPRYLNTLLSTIVNAYQHHFKEKLVAVYLRGSAARGTFVPGDSDLDVFAIVDQQGVGWESLKPEIKLQDAIDKIQFDLSVEMMFSSYSDDFRSSYPALAFIIKNQSICLFGEDLSPGIPNFKPGPQLAFHYKHLNSSLKKLSEQPHNLELIKSVSKLIIRCAFELVMDRSNLYTCDVYPATIEFLKYHPEKERFIDLTVKCYLNTINVDNSDKSNLISFGNWLSLHLEEKFS